MAVTSSIRKFVDKFIGEVDDSEYVNGYDEPEYDEYEEVEEEQEAGFGSSIRGFFGSDKKVVSMAQPQQIRMKISKPTNFDQALEIVEQLKEKNAVVINLEYVSKDVARRIVDVVSGAVKALDGNMEKVSNSIFVVAPFNYDIINEIAKEKIENKFSTSWIK